MTTDAIPIGAFIGVIANRSIAFWERKARTQNAGVARPKCRLFFLGGDQAATLSVHSLQRYMAPSLVPDVPFAGLEIRKTYVSYESSWDHSDGVGSMPRAKKIEGNLEAITARRAALEAELAEVHDAERRAREAERDAGRDTLLTALGKVKIARMDRSEATAIAKAIEKLGGAKVAAKLVSA